MSERDDERLLDMIAGELPKGAHVLNLPAGDGSFSALLVGTGYEVVSSDLFPESCTIGPQPCVEADMNARLPFEDASFDALVSQEGVEHLENLAGFLRESRRVLRPGGRIWITTPNFMDISSRLAFLLSGQKSYKAGLTNEQSTLWGRDGDRLYHGHAFSLPYFQLRYLLRVAGFSDVGVQARGWSVSSSMLYPFLLPINALLLRRGLRLRAAKDRSRSKPATDDALCRELTQQALSRPVMCGKGLAVTARLPAEA